MPDIQINERLINFILFLPVFFISLAFHEFSHAFSASRLGDDTAKNQGRLSLNPLKHIDLVGSVLMPLISFASSSFIIGWARPVPINRNNFKNKLRDDAIVSFAGPLANFILAILMFVVYVALSSPSMAESPVVQRLSGLMWMGSYFNVFLFGFNLLPIPPLDGSHILFDIFPNELTARIAGSGLYGFFILMIFIFSPLWGYFISAINFIFKLFIFAGGKL
ncbi:MAG: site-2 protease family protein [Ignavibacteria bacterium]|jgi:Zn-dependent protease|nr:site-2 protease family protein [Ignavibacteria bacterium]MCU7502037.1 site-2 protease family protein [Ignavibacteria bacterium]MCU7515439.1 site-2 protease family protein [Ignavibacteria bacterium]